jgi:tetratricopeptide (TPR) repeat protein
MLKRSSDNFEGNQLNRLERTELSGKETRHLLRRLLAEGLEGEIREGELGAAYPLMSAPLEEGNDALYGDALEGATGLTEGWSHVFQNDEESAHELLAELLSYTGQQQRLLICTEPRFQSWALCELLLDESWSAALESPGRAVHLADLAVGIAAELDEITFTYPLVCDMRARSWAYLGNARRVASDLRLAEKAFELAEMWVARGTGDPLEQARIYELRASLDMDRQRLDEAQGLLRKAMTVYRRAEDEHRQGRVLISQGLVLGRGDRVEEAVDCLRRGREQIDPAAEPRLALVAVHNLCFFLNEMGQHQEALKLLAESRQMHSQMERDLDMVRLQWLEGRIALAANQVQEAAESFADVRREFVERGVAYDAALVSLDLASAYARLGRAAEMRQLAEEMVTIFQSRDLQREAMAALIVLQKAAHMEGTSVELLDELSAMLRRSGGLE